MEMLKTPVKESVTHSPVTTTVSLQKRLENELPRIKGVTVKATHVTANLYRVNYWQRDGYPIAISKIVKSQFLQAEVGADGSLVVADKTL